MTEPIRTYARPRTFDVECPNCGRLHVVAKPHQSTRHWDHKRSRLQCGCGRQWIVGLALWMVGRQTGGKAGRPLDQIPSRRTLQSLRGIVAGKAERTSSGLVKGQIARSVRVIGEVECTCKYHRPPLQYLKVEGTEAECPVHGGKGEQE